MTDQFDAQDQMDDCRLGYSKDATQQGTAKLYRITYQSLSQERAPRISRPMPHRAFSNSGLARTVGTGNSARR
jgi:hypothetical protein